MAEFPVHLDRFTGVKNASIKKPTEIAYFSYDDDHVLHPFSDMSLRYYYPPFFNGPGQDVRFPIDLSKGFDSFRNREESTDEHLDGLLETLIAAEKRDGKKTEADVVTWRGMMTKIMTVPFETEEGFEMNATCFQGTIFIEENHAYKTALKVDQQRRFSRPGGPPQNLAMYWGYKFETLSLLDAPWGETSREEIEAREDKVVDNFAQYCSLCRTGIGGASMIIGGEVDGVLGYKPTDPNEPPRWIELKTARRPQNDKNIRIHEKKLMKFWAQSFLLGVPRIYIGYRSPDGILENIEELDTQRIPSTIQRTGRFRWDGNLCINFTGAFLAFLKQTIGNDDNDDDDEKQQGGGGGVWRIRRAGNGGAPIEVFKVEETGTGEVLKQSFLDWRRRLVGEGSSSSSYVAPFAAQA